jgi:hypothetical protein
MQLAVALAAMIGFMHGDRAVAVQVMAPVRVEDLRMAGQFKPQQAEPIEEVVAVAQVIQHPIQAAQAVLELL